MNKEPLDCTNVPAGKVLNYYIQGTIIWMPYDRYVNFLAYIGKNGPVAHEGETHWIEKVKGVKVKRTIK